MKRFISLLLLLVILIPSNVFALENENYYKGISIGLKSMASTSFEITLNGDYYYNGQLYSSGKIFKVNYLNNDIIVDGLVYTNGEFVALNKTSTMKIFSTNKNISRNYRGSLKFTTYLSDVIPIITLDMEEYLYGVVPHEMPSSYNDEALKAQAITARTYAIKNFNKKLSLAYNLDDTTECQVFKGTNDSLTKAINAVNSTKGIIMTYNNIPIDGLYSASNGGYTDKSSNVWTSDSPYLIALPDPFDTYLWTVVMSKEQINETLKSKGYLDANFESFDSINTNNMLFFESGRISYMEFSYLNDKGDTLNKAITKDLARTFLGFKSSIYTVEFDSNTDTYTFNGKGNGHGIGLSQIGANSRANSGYNYVDILKFYYNGIQLQNILKTDNVTYNNVTYNSKGGSSINTEAVSYDNLLKEPFDPLKSGFTFVGWYKDIETLNPWIFSSDHVKTDLTLYAKWKASLPQSLNYEEKVQYISGYPSGEFKASGNITRAEASTLFYNLSKNKTIDKEISFNDLSPNEWYYKSMITLSSKNMISGYPDGSIKPTKPITRAEFVTLVSRFAELASGEINFTDLSSSHWAYKYVVSAAEKGWLSGYPDGSFKPNDNITRAEAVKIINSMLGRVTSREELDNASGLKYFTDVSKSHWAYYQIIDAANNFLSE